jgi:hypothetical protein
MLTISIGSIWSTPDHWFIANFRGALEGVVLSAEKGAFLQKNAPFCFN